MNLATAEEFRDEIARLQAEIDRLRSQPCPYVTGNVTKHCTLTRLTLTDEERALIEMLADHPVTHELMPNEVATLRGLLERVSDRPKPIATPLAECTPGVCTYPPECTDTGET